jgi:hypothetical protein
VIGKGQAKGSDPQQAAEGKAHQTPASDGAPAPDLMQGLTTARDEAGRDLQSSGPESKARPSGLLFAMRPSEAMPVRNVQVRVPEPIADLLKVMALYERTSQQVIMERAITDVVREWHANYERERAGG